MKKFILILMFVALFPTCVFAYTYSVGFDNSTPFNTTALTGFSTTGAMMDGMTVTAWYANGSTDSATWADTATTSGAASNFGFSLSESGDTFGGTWSLIMTQSLTPITSIKIDGGTGNTVFDTIRGTSNSPGSASGWPFEVISASNQLAIDAIYSSPVSIGGTFYGDMYRSLTLNFTNTEGFEPGYNLSFIADTDNLLYPNDLNPAVPEPATFLLLGSGLAGLAFYRRKRK